MVKKKGMLDQWQEAALKLADQLGIIDHDFTVEDLEPIKKALKKAHDSAKEQKDSTDEG